MSDTRTRRPDVRGDGRRDGRTTRRERAAVQSQAARERQAPHPGAWARAARFVRKADPEEGDAADIVEPAAWRPIAALVLSLAGLGVSTYLTVAHFAKARLACSDTGLVNCQKVTTSAQSYFLHVPVALWGLLFFVAFTVVNLPAAWRTLDRRVHALRLVMSAAGMCFVLYLVSAEFLIIKNICLWCTSVHVITFLSFVLVVTTVPQMLGWDGGSRTAQYETG